MQPAPHPDELSGSGIDRDEPRWARLHRIIAENSLLTGDFTLSSGRKSNYLFQLRQTTLHPEGASLIGEIVVDFMRRHGLKGVGGLELGAVPLVTAIACASHYANHPVSAFFIRKKAKEHGARERIDGHVPDGAEVLIVDDVTTTGASVLRCLEALREEHHCTARWALSIVDREEGAEELLHDHALRLASIFRKSDFRI